MARLPWRRPLHRARSHRARSHWARGRPAVDREPVRRLWDRPFPPRTRAHAARRPRWRSTCCPGGPALGVDDAGLPAAVAAVHGADRARLRALRRRLRRTPGRVKVETRLTSADPTALTIGMDMELVLVRSGPTTKQ